MSKNEAVHRCEEKIWSGFHAHPCGNKAKYEHDGTWYCKRHHPPSVAEKRRLRDERWEREWSARSARNDLNKKRESLRDDLEQLAIECADMSITQYPVSNTTRLENIGRQLAKLRNPEPEKTL